MPTKPIGPVMDAEQAARAVREHGWAVAPDGAGLRRVVASPRPVRVLSVPAVRWLLAHHAVVIAAGGGGIPVVRSADGTGMQGVEAVIDKDLCSAMLACELDAELLVIATDVAGIQLDWGLPGQRLLRHATPHSLDALWFPAGSMRPKVEAAQRFVRVTGRRAVIGPLESIQAMLAGQAGTQVESAGPFTQYGSAPTPASSGRQTGMRGDT